MNGSGISRQREKSKETEKKGKEETERLLEEWGKQVET